MNMPQRRVSDGFHLMGLGLVAISILCGRITLSKFLSAGYGLGNIEVANYLLLASLVIIAALCRSGYIDFKLSIRPLIIVAAIAFYLLGLTCIDLLAHRIPDTSVIEEAGRVLLTVAALCLLLTDGKQTKQFMILIVAIGLLITVGDFIGWRVQRLQLITGLSTSRINLFVLGTAVTLYLGTHKSVWLAAAALAIFTLMSGSMKIGMVAAVAALGILIVGLLSTRRFDDTVRICAAVSLGVVISIFTGDIHNTLSRVEAVNASSTAVPATASYSQNNDPEALATCQSTQSPGYCANPFLTIPDPTERLRLFAHAISLIKTAPVFGLGQNAFQLSLWYKVDGRGSLNIYNYPHNLFLDVGVTHGLVGIVFLLILLSICVILVLSTFSGSPATIGLLAAATGVLICSMTGGDFYDARYIFICAILSALGSLNSGLAHPLNR
jgi:hypothetical protein